jgi:hypothetical protein
VSTTPDPPRDRISRVAEQLEASAGDLRGLSGVSRLRAALPDAVATLRHIADQVLEQSVELDDLRAHSPMTAEQQQDDGDVRAVAAAAAADDDEQLDRAVSELIARFAGRIAALEARDAMGTDAAQDGLSATETSELQFDASASATKPGGAQRGAQGLCESERNDETGTGR